MHQGDRAPRTRARWQTSLVPAGYWNLPTWLQVVGGFWSYADPVSPITIRFVFGFHCAPARWSYQRHDAMVFYQGTWNDGHYDGKWWWGCRPDDTHHSFCVTAITLPLGDPTSGKYIHTSGTTDADPFFVPTIAQPLYNTHEIQKDAPWVAHSEGSCQWLTYHEITAIHENAHDTSPLSWTGSFSP